MFKNRNESLGEKLEREDVDTLVKECCDPEDEDGFIPYERRSHSWLKIVSKIENAFCFFLAFLKRICAGPHPEMYEDW